MFRPSQMDPVTREFFGDGERAPLYGAAGTNPSTSELFVQRWREIELGWGERPDGVSVHRDAEECARWVAAEAERQRQFPGEFSVPDGDPQPVRLPTALAETIMGARASVRCWSAQLPAECREILAAAGVPCRG